eukprot:COSAG01_NODE_10_length_42970_cov_93.010007_34_plen_35_part_00
MDTSITELQGHQPATSEESQELSRKNSDLGCILF